ncbi:hypothetical protein FGO68_gene5760 [Halteria grandinella]|uniref:Uncharacterized protein n=1 Tax=Halteria grandinella TaxID=5974 RepID=A0A8J8NJP2_HALGN|nr:hypothetical protein FGO68_gene5760 [Halteria grandinella]
MYDRMMSKPERNEQSLVDFEQKKWDAKDRERKDQMQGREQETQQDYVSELNQINDEIARQRRAWEEEARSEIAYTQKTGLSAPVVDSASSKLSLAMTPLVKQRWDQILTPHEKEKLAEVIQDKQRQGHMQMLAKRKREEERAARQAKIEEIKKRVKKTEDTQ